MEPKEASHQLSRLKEKQDKLQKEKENNENESWLEQKFSDFF
jgi:hypothetical protein